MRNFRESLIAAEILLAIVLFFTFREDSMGEILIDYIFIFLNFFESEAPHTA